MGYQLPVFQEYVLAFDSEVYVMHWDHKKLTPYIPAPIEGVYYYNRSEYNLKQLKEFVLKTDPDIIFVSGWMDKDYLRAVRPFRKKGMPVVTGFDGIWFKTFRQRVASVLFPILKNQFFSHAWVTGPYQYEYAKRLGFKNNEIIHNLYSADISLFNKVYTDCKIVKAQKYPHKFLFVGRFENVKGVDILMNAWSNIKKRNESKDWELTLIGNGSLYYSISKTLDIKIINFLQPEELIETIKNYGCFVLPSIFEPWALVLHEFAAAGFPIICSEVCGAVPVFITDNYNGYTFKSGDVKDLEKQMLKIINSSDKDLLKMSENSHALGQRITPQISAASFMSVLFK
jgi:glycosyltransferase involved in cell wall biosynthesis